MMTRTTTRRRKGEAELDQGNFQLAGLSSLGHSDMEANFDLTGSFIEFPDPMAFPEFDVGGEGHHLSATGDDEAADKKLTHNAYERDRRRKMNALYSSLRSLLPQRYAQKRQLSIPSTVFHALGYIPTLERQVQRLERRKEEILRRTSKQGEEGQGSINGRRIANDDVYPLVSAMRVTDREVMVQICYSKSDAHDNGSVCEFSRLLKRLAEERLLVVYASTANISSDRASWHIHLQGEDVVNIEDLQRMLKWHL